MGPHETLYDHLSFIIPVEICGILWELWLIVDLNLEVLDYHSHFDASVAGEFFGRISDSQFYMPLGNDNDTIAKVGNVNVDIFSLMTLLESILCKVGLDKEGPIRNEESRVSSLNIALNLWLSNKLFDFREVAIRCENLSEENLEGTWFHVLFGANCFGL